MMEVSTKNWKTLCERIKEQRRGATLTIAVIEPGGREVEIGTGLIFESMDFRKDPCNDIISVRARGEREIVHDIIEPIHIRLREVNEGTTYNSIAIEAENGTTFLTFHPVIHAGLLEGLDTD